MKSRKAKPTDARRTAGRDLPPKFYSDVEIVRLAWLAIFVSVFSFLYFLRRDQVLLYGDAVAHINIARRVFDSRTPGLLQLGTVWLPLPHLLILPFIVSKQMWQSGSGGSMPSMAGFVLGAVGIFRLAKSLLGTASGEGHLAGMLPWLAALIYAANPNLIYLQATAMGESLYLALFIWSLFFFVEFVRGDCKAGWKCGFTVLAACFTRYDGWFLAVLLVAAGLTIFGMRHFKVAGQPETGDVSQGAVLVKFILLAAAGPVLWLGYNAVVYRNPLEFANGPYSARAIEQKTHTVNPAKGSLSAASSYFLKAAELNVSEAGAVGGRVWLALAILGSVVAWFEKRWRWAVVLWMPLPFYALSIAYGGVPIFVPPWWPSSIYNARYGLQLLPAFALFVPLGIRSVVRGVVKIPAIAASLNRWCNAITILLVLLLAAPSYGAMWQRGAICYREADINGKGRIALDRQLGQWLLSLPADSTLLMYLGEHVGALERVGIPLQRTINEGNHRMWMRPNDPDGLWERALRDPAAYADYLVGFEGDPVWQAAQANHLKSLVAIHTTGQPAAIIFQGRELRNAANGAR